MMARTIVVWRPAILAVAALSAIGSVSAQRAVEFERDVLPIFQQRCYSCHAERDMAGKKRRIKGGLRLDGAEHIVRGGDGGRVLVAGEPEQSELFTRTILPPDHDDIMPARGEPLAEAQIGTLRSWIANGAKFGGWTGAAAPKLEKDTKRVARRAPVQRERWYADVAKGLSPLAGDSPLLGFEDAQVEPVVPGSAVLRVEFYGHESDLTDQRLAGLLQKLGPRVAHLSLAKTAITDRSARVLASLPRLVWLDLRDTAIGDATVAELAKAKTLRHLNLVGTKVTDRALLALTEHVALEALFLWRSEVTAAGVQRLREQQPNWGIRHEPTFPAAAPRSNDRSNRRGPRPGKRAGAQKPGAKKPAPKPAGEAKQKRKKKRRGADR